MRCSRNACKENLESPFDFQKRQNDPAKDCNIQITKLSKLGLVEYSSVDLSFENKFQKSWNFANFKEIVNNSLNYAQMFIYPDDFLSAVSIAVTLYR